MTNTPKTIVRRTPWPDSISRAVGTPLQPSVVYASQTPDELDAQYGGQVSGYTYAREGHPNADVLARKIDGMEGAEGGFLLSSGMAAVSAVMLGLLKAGDHVVGGDQLYGRSLRLMTQDLPRFGIDSTLADPTDAAAIAAALRPETRMIVIELVSNPTLRVADMEGIAQIAKERGILLVVDNTFTTPRAFQPFDHGADIAIHSVTKLLSGHSDVTLGYVAMKDLALRDEALARSVTYGLTPSPYDCWMAERGLFSFELRYDRAEQTAAALADALADTPGIRRVVYPGRADHPDHARAAGLLKGRFGNMLSFDLDGGRAQANAFTKACPQIAFAPTLGDVATMLSHPASSSHRAIAEEERLAVGISEGFFRVSVGIEPADMLIDEMCSAVRVAMGT